MEPQKSILMPITLSVVISGILFGGLGYYIRDIIPPNDTTTDNPTATSTSKVTAQTQASASVPFCKEYGTFQVKKSDLLEQYIVGPGDTLRDIAKNKLGNEAKATSIIEANTELSNYEIDDPLPLQSKLYLPNDKYTIEGVTTYAKSKGNITYNKEKPFFGVSATNSATGPFTIQDTFKDSLKNISEGQCVTVIYGSRGYDSEKVVLEVTPQ